MNKQTIIRAWQTLRLLTITSSGRRAEYLRQHHIFYHIGKDCTIVERKVPLYPRLISIGNNVHLAAKVLLVPHDAIHLCLNNMAKTQPGGGVVHYQERLGCIEIGDNVFIGANTTVLYNVKIGSNVVVGAGSLVNKDIPDNTIAAGCPAKVIGTFDDFMKKREKEIYPESIKPTGHRLSLELEAFCWRAMKESREQQ